MNGKAAKSKSTVVTVSIEKSEFKDLIEAIQNLVKVYAAAQIKREDGTERNARFLKVFGLSEYEIADLLGITQPAVNQALSKPKKKKGTKSKKGSDDAVTKT
jgi:predicted XRE-type DNA-binding protein